MQFSVLLLALAAALTTKALPFDTINDSNLRAEASPISNLPSKAVQCGGKNARAASYSISDIQKAAEASLQHIVDNTVVPPNNYPKFYKYTDDGVKLDPSACKKGDDLYEFPITRGIYTGSQDITQIADRVIIKRKGKKAMYCGLVTHLGAAGNGFVSCSG